MTRGYGMRVPRELSDRQREVADLVAHGLSNKEVAAELGITEDTAKNHVSAAFRFAGVENRTELTRWWMEQEAGTPDPVPAPEPRPEPIGWTLALAVVVAQLLDLATWVAMPRAAEVNPIAQGLHTQSAWLAKGALVVLVLAIQPLLRPKYRAVGELVAVVAIAAGCVGAGSNLAVLSYVAAAAPKPASQPAPVPSGSTGYEQGTMVLAADSRTPAPRQSAIAATVRGRASWYGVDGDVAAAGPALRHGHWRGSLVAVCADRCVTVRLVDACQCHRGTPTERLLDLSPSAFAKLAPLSAGLVRVTVQPIRVLPPATDR